MTSKKARLIGFQLGMKKKSLDLGSLLEGAQENAPLIGAGAGGLAGLASGMGGDDEEEQEQKSPMIRALLGALLGGGAGLGAKHLPGMLEGLGGEEEPANILQSVSKGVKGIPSAIGSAASDVGSAVSDKGSQLMELIQQLGANAPEGGAGLAGGVE